MIVAHHEEHESLVIGSLLLGLQRPSTHQSDLYVHLLVKGPIPHGER